jgi:chromosome segregation ATPase
MTMRIHGGALKAVVLALLVPAGGVRAAVPVASEGETLALLLEEVRGLRRSVEELGRANLRLQVTLQRLGTQQQQVRTLTEQGAELEAAISSSVGDLERAKAQLAELQDRMEQETDVEQRRALAQERRSLRDVIERQTTQEQDLRRRAADVAQSLVTETATLNDLTDGLAEMDPAPASGARRPAHTTAKPAPGR